MAKSKYVKLGEKASMFYDPTTKLKVVPGQVVELSNDNLRSKRIIRAIKAGHLDHADSDDLEELTVITLKSLEAPTKAKAKDDDDDGDEEVTKISLMRFKKDELIERAMEEGSEFSQEELDELKKDQLVDEILGLLEEE